MEVNGKRRRTIAREGVGEREREEEREEDVFGSLSPQTKNAGYDPANHYARNLDLVFVIFPDLPGKRLLLSYVTSYLDFKYCRTLISHVIIPRFRFNYLAI